MQEQKQEHTLQTVARVAPDQTPILTDQTTERDLSSQQVAELLARVQRKIRRRKIRYWSFFALAEAPGVFAIFCSFTALFGHKLNPFLWLGKRGSLMAAVVLVGAVGLLISSLRPLAADVEEIVQVGGVKTIGPLIDALSAPAYNRDAVYAALALLLPQLKASDAHLLSARQRRQLLSLLRWGSTMWPNHRVHDLKLAILKAFEQVGDAKAVPAVERLARRKPRTERQRRLQEAAEACLPLLRTNLGLVEATQTLLRPAAAQPPGADMLVRPAGAASDSESGVLLRPADDR